MKPDFPKQSWIWPQRHSLGCTRSIAARTAVEPSDRPDEARLLYARALEGLGECQQALAEYESLVTVYVGLEARCRYGMLLKQLGFTTQATHVFQEVLEYARRFRINLDTERPWIDAARRHVAVEA